MPTFDLAETCIGVFHNAATWDSWEMHPAGDDIVCLLSGSLDVVLDEDGAERNIELRPLATCIVPRSVWHRAVVHVPGDTLHITRGAGTQHRPVEHAGQSAAS